MDTGISVADFGLIVDEIDVPQEKHWGDGGPAGWGQHVGAAEDCTGPDCGPARKVSRRGTSNGNERGSSETRRRRREWLVATYRADKDVLIITGLIHGPMTIETEPGDEAAQPACRCYRCGCLLTVDTVTADRIVPGAHGGTYRRTNIRPACGRCNSSTGATVRRKR